MAITATQGMVAVGLLSVLFGGDVMTLLGSKVRACSAVLLLNKHKHNNSIDICNIGCRFPSPHQPKALLQISLARVAKCTSPSAAPEGTSK